MKIIEHNRFTYKLSETRYDLNLMVESNLRNLLFVTTGMLLTWYCNILSNKFKLRCFTHKGIRYRVPRFIIINVYSQNGAGIGTLVVRDFYVGIFIDPIYRRMGIAKQLVKILFDTYPQLVLSITNPSRVSSVSGMIMACLNIPVGVIPPKGTKMKKYLSKMEEIGVDYKNTQIRWLL